MALIILGITFVLLTTILGGYLLYKSANKVASPISQAKPTTSPVEDLATWTDQAEFSFQYPKSLKLNPHEEDEENYAHVELTSSSNSGNLIVWVKDTIADTTDAYVKQKKLNGGIDSTLDGEKAIKILTSDESDRLTVSSIRNGYLYQIEVNLEDKEHWQKIYETVYSSFKFIEGSTPEKKTELNTKAAPVEQSESGQTGGEEDLGEEVIE